MRRPSRFYLNLGSNIQPEHNLANAIRRLRGFGLVQATSRVWESHAVGSTGPNFLNVCVAFVAPLSQRELKQGVVDAIEKGLGRTRTSDKNAPRTIDIDIIMVDDQPLNLERWSHPFVLLPMADLLPDLPHPISGRRLSEEAIAAKESVWIQLRPDVLMDSEEASST